MGAIAKQTLKWKAKLVARDFLKKMQKVVEALVKFVPSGLAAGLTVHALLQNQWTQAVIMTLLTSITSLWVKFSSEFMKQAEEEAAKRGGGFAKWSFALLDQAIAALQTRMTQLWQEITSDFEDKYWLIRKFGEKGSDHQV